MPGKVGLCPVVGDKPKVVCNNAGMKTSNAVVCGRKFCIHPQHAGPRWVLAINFSPTRRTSSGAPLYLHPWCKTCALRDRRRRHAKRLSDPRYVEAKRLSYRLYAERKRRERGAKPRKFNSPHGYTKKPLPEGRGSGGVLTPTVDAGPLLEVFERWRTARQGEMERERGDIGVVAIDDLLGASGARAISRARQTGRMEIATADRILYAMNSHLSIHDLWPDI
jgi:hypothetical protein